MISIERVATPVSPTVSVDILELVAENVTSLSMTSPPKSHPLFDGYKTLLVEEVRAYITCQNQPQIEVITASAPDGRVIGFLLIGLVKTDVQECNIYYTAVQKQFRRQGIMGRMMQVVLGMSSAVGLSCDVQMVPIYKRYGFRAVDTRATQIVMFIGDPTGITPILSVEDLKKLTVVDTAFGTAAQQSTPYEIRRADKLLGSDLEARKAKAKQFLRANK